MFVDEWVLDTMPLRKIVYPTDQYGAFTPFAQLVAGEKKFLGWSSLRLHLESILVDTQCLRPYKVYHPENVRMAVIQGFLERAFPRFSPAIFNHQLSIPPIPDILTAEAIAARLGVYVPLSHLEDNFQRVLLANHYVEYHMTPSVWLCPHCPESHQDASSRWEHIVAVHRDVIQR